LVLVVQPGAVTNVSLLAAAALTALLAASLRWRIDAPALAALLLPI
jgi:preprotein translocase subunit SecD